MKTSKKKAGIGKRLGRALFIYVIVTALLLATAGTVSSESIVLEETDGTVSESAESAASDANEAAPAAENETGSALPDEAEETAPGEEPQTPADEAENGLNPEADEEQNVDAPAEESTDTGSAAISGQTWLDENGNGVWDEDEAGISGITVTLEQKIEDVWQAVDSALTENGAYLFDGLPEGTYRITATLEGSLAATYQFYGESSESNAAKTTSEAELDAEGSAAFDFALRLLEPETASISGTVFLDEDGNNEQGENETGVEGVSVVLQHKQPDETWAELPAEQVTGQDGTYEFTELETGEYRVVLKLDPELAQTLELNPLNQDYISAGEELSAPLDESWLVSNTIALSPDTATALDAALQPLGLTVDEDGIRVYNFAELREVLLDTSNQYGTTVYIYLMNDITVASGGIDVSTNKVNITIDGHPPESEEGYSVTFTDYNGGTTNQSNSIRVGSGTTLTVKNLNLYGYNYYGPFSSDAGSVPGSTMIFVNVSYQGPQMVYNPHGSVTLHNVTAELRATSDAQVQELSESTNLTMSGNVNIARTAAPAYTAAGGTPLAVFYTYNSAAIVVESNAVVTITTTDYVFWHSTANTTLTVREGAVMTVRAANGFLDTALYSLVWYGHAMQSINVQSGATLSITQTGGSSPKQMLLVTNSLTVGEGAVLEVFSASSLYPIETSGSLLITFNNPERVILSSASSVIRKTGTGTVTLRITTQATNLWASAIPTDSISTSPTYIWNNASLTAYTINATLTSSGMTSVSATPAFTADDSASALTNATFNVTTAKGLVLGSYELTVNPVYPDDGVVTGTTLSGAGVRVSYTDTASTQVTSTATAAQNGEYSVAIAENSLQSSTVLTIQSEYDYLNARVALPASGIRTTLSASASDVVFKTEEQDAPITLQVKMENMISPAGAKEIVGLEWFRVSASDTADYSGDAFAAGYAAAAGEDKGTGADMSVDAATSNDERNYEMPVGENGIYWVKTHYRDENGEDYEEVGYILIDNIYTPSSGSYRGVSSSDGSTLYEGVIPGTTDSGTWLAGVALDLHSTETVLNSTSDGTTAVAGTGAQLVVEAEDPGSLWTLVSPSPQTISVSGTALPTVEFLYDLDPLAITVRFDSAGGEPDEIPDQYYAATDTFGALPAVSLTDHSFAGWFTDPAAGTMVQEGDAMPAQWAEGSTVTLYAQWLFIPQTLTISNSVAGEYGDLSFSFTFTIYFEDENGLPLDEGTQFAYSGGVLAGSGAEAPADGTLALDGDGKAALSLSNGQTVSIDGVLATGSVRVAAEANTLYTVSFVDSEDGSPTDSADTGMRSMTYETRTFDFTYTRNEVVESGVSSGSSGLLLLSAAALLAGVVGLAFAVVCRRQLTGRRRHE